MGIEKKAENRSITGSAGMEVRIVTGLGATGWLWMTKALIFHRSWTNFHICLSFSSNFHLSFLLKYVRYRVTWLVWRHLGSLRRGWQGRCHPQLLKQVGIGELLGMPDWFAFNFYWLLAAKSLLTSLEWEACSLEGNSEKNFQSVEVSSGCSSSAISSVTHFLIWWCGMSK